MLEKRDKVEVENLLHAQGGSPDFPWYARSLRQFNSAPEKLPIDHHELIAMIAPRAVLMIESTQIPRMGAEAARVDALRLCNRPAGVSTSGVYLKYTSPAACAAYCPSQPSFGSGAGDRSHGHRRRISMNPNQALWEKGDFTRIAATMRESGAALVQRIGVRKGMKVLDLGCGDGTTAIPAARLGADVLGVDIARNLVDAGNRRAKENGLANCKFQEGDASNLHELKDQSFDLVVSIFGAMFAPKPFDVAREGVRVTRRGGRIVMGNWIPNDPTLVAQILKISSAYTPPPPEGFVSPMTWGVEQHVLERFAAAGVPKDQISFARETFTFNSPGRPTELLDAFRKYYGPTMNAFEAAEKNGGAADLQQELEALFNGQNTSPDKDATSIPATFLRVTVAI